MVSIVLSSGEEDKDLARISELMLDFIESIPNVSPHETVGTVFTLSNSQYRVVDETGNDKTLGL